MQQTPVVLVDGDDRLAEFVGFIFAPQLAEGGHALLEVMADLLRVRPGIEGLLAILHVCFLELAFLERLVRRLAPLLGCLGKGQPAAARQEGAQGKHGDVSRVHGTASYGFERWDGRGLGTVNLLDEAPVGRDWPTPMPWRLAEYRGSTRKNTELRQ